MFLGRAVFGRRTYFGISRLGGEKTGTHASHQYRYKNNKTKLLKNKCAQNTQQKAWRAFFTNKWYNKNGANYNTSTEK